MHQLFNKLDALKSRFVEEDFFRSHGVIGIIAKK